MVIEKDFTCIVCPRGCTITAKFTDDVPPVFISATGYSCPRGLKWIKQEIEAPTRTFATSIAVSHGEFENASVRTAKPVPLEKIFDVMEAIKKVRVEAPVKIGDVVLTSPAGVDTEIIITRNVNRK